MRTQSLLLMLFFFNALASHALAKSVVDKKASVINVEEYWCLPSTVRFAYQGSETYHPGITGLCNLATDMWVGRDGPYKTFEHNLYHQIHVIFSVDGHPFSVLLNANDTLEDGRDRSEFCKVDGCKIWPPAYRWAELDSDAVLNNHDYGFGRNVTPASSIYSALIFASKTNKAINLKIEEGFYKNQVLKDTYIVGSNHDLRAIELAGRWIKVWISPCAGNDPCEYDDPRVSKY